MGFNAKQGGSTYLIANSHCTTQQGVLEHSVLDIGSYTSGPWIFQELVGEVADPALFSCALGPKCRRSDAALFRYTYPAHANFGKIILTTIVGTTSAGSQVVADKRTIGFEAAPLMGQTLWKTGLFSGTTKGPVSGTCVNTVATTGVGYLCQATVDAWAQPGDSGSPVWSADVTPSGLYGILWGRTTSPLRFYFSSIANIHQELGAFTTF
jgi:hypothetical protein